MENYCFIKWLCYNLCMTSSNYFIIYGLIVGVCGRSKKIKECYHNLGTEIACDEFNHLNYISNLKDLIKQVGLKKGYAKICVALGVIVQGVLLERGQKHYYDDTLIEVGT